MKIKNQTILVLLFTIAIAFSSCEKDDYGPAFMKLTVDSETYEWNNCEATFNSSEPDDYTWHISSNSIGTDGPYNYITFSSGIGGTGTFNASNYDIYGDNISLFRDNMIRSDLYDNSYTEYTITKYESGKVIEGSFEGYVREDDDEVFVQGTFRAIN